MGLYLLVVSSTEQCNRYVHEKCTPKQKHLCARMCLCKPLHNHTTIWECSPPNCNIYCSISYESNCALSPHQFLTHESKLKPSPEKRNKNPHKAWKNIRYNWSHRVHTCIVIMASCTPIKSKDFLTSSANTVKLKRIWLQKQLKKKIKERQKHIKVTNQTNTHKTKLLKRFRFNKQNHYFA